MPSSASAEAGSVTYEVAHETRYAYTEPVAVSHHVARLRPRALPYQTPGAHALEVTPAPAVRAEHADYYGNPTSFFAMQRAHSGLTVAARSTVTVHPRNPASLATPAWEEAARTDRLPLDALDALFDPVAGAMPDEVVGYARPSFPPGRPLLDAVLELTRRIHDDFTFDPGATTVTTSLADIFRLRRGVCQDFARFEIACLRSLGLAAHYVSGYLETEPPPGEPRRIGADASHAWLAVYCPGTGWVDLDPTNNMLPSTGHITLAWGRDYGDVSPIRGVILGGGVHALEVKVDVVRA